MVGRLAVYAALGLLLGAVEPACAPADNAREPALEDAQLSDVAFVDAEQGWAVGDRGVIWHTVDGGHHWALQTSGVDCRLSAVRFLDTRHGWAAGGAVKPYTGTTAGVLLETRDGGQHWQLDRTLMLPGLTDIKFFDAHHGWAVGRPSALFPAGVFTTDDGGRSWSGLPSGEGQNWLAGDFADPAAGTVVGRAGSLGAIRHRGVELQTTDAGLRTLSRVRLDAAGGAWLIGDGGLVRVSADSGQSWHPPAGALPPHTEGLFDFGALAVRGRQCWIAGTPGTRIMYTGDGGETWQAQPTGQNLPIRALAFVDDRQGWAVGDLGLILTTRDGGQTWQRQRGTGRRAALVGFYGQPADVPLELFARLSAEEGYLGVVEILNRGDFDAKRSERVDLPAAAHDAVVRAGGSGANCAWQFPVREPGLKFAPRQLIAGWTAAEGRPLDQLDAYLVRQIRIWRPSVVFLPATGANADAQSQLLAQAVLAAVERAGEPAAHPDQIAAAGLATWKVDKVFGSLPAGETGTVSLSTAQLSARRGRSLAELASGARGTVDAQYRLPPATLGFRLLVDRLPQERGTRDFFSGIALQAGGEARRTLEPVSEASLDRVRRTTQARRNLQAILGQANRADADAARWLAEVGQFTQSLDESSAAELLFQLAERYYRSGRWDFAAETFEMIATRYPQHPLSGAALVWLVQYYSSSEAAWRMTKTEQINARQVVAVEPRRASGAAGPLEIQAPQILADSRLIAGVNRADKWPARAAAFGKALEQSEAPLYVEPEIRFPLAAAHRRQGLARQAERFYLAARRSTSADAWSLCGAGEQWLATRQGSAPKEVAACGRAPGKPRLDGTLDDSVWQQAARLELHSPSRDDESWSAVAMLARDDEFLYWAASCRLAPGGPTAESPKTRQRDADLTGQDRIELCLDLDRDWTTFYRFSVGQTGATADQCWHDASWNPGWFVAAAHTDDAWTMEAAIPLAELTREFPAAGEAWAVGMTRVVPGVGLQSWSKPAAVEPIGAGFGFLIFE